MLGNHYSHEILKKATYCFRQLFDNIYVIYRDEEGKITSQVKVPIAYAQKSRLLDAIELRNNSQLNIFQPIGMNLPAMGFEIIGMNYDPVRQLCRVNELTVSRKESEHKTVFTRVPYNVQLQINIATRSWDEFTQIKEQIISVFNPSYTFRVKPLDDYPDVVDNYPLVLNGVSWLDDNDGDVKNRREVVDVIDFEMKIYFYGEVRNGKPIHDVITDFSTTDDPFASFENIQVSSTPENPDVVETVITPVPPQ